MLRWALIAAAVSGMAAVLIGATGAHVLSDLPVRAHDFFNTAERYHFVHALALALAALAPAAGAHRGACQVACGLWLAGILVFSGSLYLLALSGTDWLGSVTPFGGMALIAGWLALIVAAVLRPS